MPTKREVEIERDKMLKETHDMCKKILELLESLDVKKSTKTTTKSK